MAATWMTADLHLGHLMVANLRSCSTTEEHDQAISLRWRRMVHPDDTVWVVGDISSGSSSGQEHALEVIEKLPGRKLLVAGNHDSVHPLHGMGQVIKWMKEYSKVFDWVGTSASINIEGEKLRVCHFPYSADHTVLPRYVDWRLPDLGKWLAHGHTHSREFMQGKELHVGLDAHRMKPVNLGELGKAIKHYKGV